MGGGGGGGGGGRKKKTKSAMPIERQRNSGEGQSQHCAARTNPRFNMLTLQGQKEKYERVAEALLRRWGVTGEMGVVPGVKYVCVRGR